MKVFIVGISWIVLFILFYKIEASIFTILSSFVFITITYMRKSPQFVYFLFFGFLLFMLTMLLAKIEFSFILVWISSPVLFATIYMKNHPPFAISSLAIFLLFTIGYLVDTSPTGSTGALIFVFLPIYSIGFGVIVQYLSSLADKYHDQDDSS